jgi:GDP-4-dehydro-6-deoxy-D-mannose reductase
MARYLISGVAGMAGSHLVEFLLSLNQGIEIYGVDKLNVKKDNIKHLMDKFTYQDLDLTDHIAVRHFIRTLEPDRIFHLAAMSYVPYSFQSPQETLNNNIISELNILEAMRDLNNGCIIQIAGSSEEYGLVLEHELPIKEFNPLRPLSPYAVSKVTQDKLALQYWSSYNLNVVVTRAFNHTGPRRTDCFMTSSFAKQLAEIEAKVRPAVMQVGNLEAKRDFSDVRDIVRAYWLATEYPEKTVGHCFNICSGKAWSAEEVLLMLMKMTSVTVSVNQNPNLLRASDVPILLGDCSKFKEATNWEPQIPFDKTLLDLLNFWRDHVAQKVTQRIVG